MRDDICQRAGDVRIGASLRVVQFVHHPARSVDLTGSIFLGEVQFCSFNFESTPLDLVESESDSFLFWSVIA